MTRTDYKWMGRVFYLLIVGVFAWLIYVTPKERWGLTATFLFLSVFYYWSWKVNGDWIAKHFDPERDSKRNKKPNQTSEPNATCNVRRMKMSLTDAAVILGFRLRNVGERSAPAWAAPATRVIEYYDCGGGRRVDVMPSPEQTIVTVSETATGRFSRFELQGAFPTSSERVAAYLERDPKLMAALRGGTLGEAIDWMDYK